MRVRAYLIAVSLVLAGGFAAAHGGTLLVDDFESYADTTAMNAAWNEPAIGVGTLDTANGNPGQSMDHPGGTTNKRLFPATVPTDAAPIIWEFDFFDDAEGNKRVTGGLRDNGGGAGLNSILEMGRYNDIADPESATTVSGYGVRTVFIGGDPPNWVSFAGNPAVEEGWHHMRATIGASSILFELDLGDDGSVDASRLVNTPSGSGIAYNVARLGGPSDLSSPGGSLKFDNLSIVQIPEPTTTVVTVLGLLGIVAAARRRNR
jgi:hypothetical protein